MLCGNPADIPKSQKDSLQKTDARDARNLALRLQSGVLHGKFVWGLTASDGPGPACTTVKGVQRTFYNYIARGAPYGPDDGTIAPWVCITALPFAPKLVLKVIRFVMGIIFLLFGKNKGFQASFNASFPKKGGNPFGWLSTLQFGLNRGPVVIMIENYLSGHTWKVFKESPHIVRGLRKAGFKRGWLDEVK